MSATSETIKSGNFLREYLQQKSAIGWLFCTITIALIISIPIFSVLSSLLLPSSETWHHLKSTVLADYVSNSLILVIGVSLGTLVIGISTAWICSVYEFPGRKVLSWSLLLPLAFPPYIIAYTYTGMLDFSGPLQTCCPYRSSRSKAHRVSRPSCHIQISSAAR